MVWKVQVKTINTKKSVFSKVKMGYSHVNSRGNKYFLHSQVMKNGKTLYFFSKKEENETDLPTAYKVVENQKTGLPLLKKK